MWNLKKQQTNKHKKRLDLWLPGKKDGGRENWREVVKGTHFSYKIHIRDVMYTTTSRYIRKLLRVNPRSCHHKEKKKFVCIIYEKMDISQTYCGNHITYM